MFYRALHIACQSNSLDLIRLLLNAGAYAGAATKQGETPIHIICTKIPEANCMPPTGDKTFRTYDSILKALIINGANIDTQDEKKFTPLAYACTAGRLDVVYLLLKYNSNSKITTKYVNDLCFFFYFFLQDMKIKI
jgi:ankyrin repeat protein